MTSATAEPRSVGGRADEVATDQVHAATERPDPLGGLRCVAAVEERDIRPRLGERDGGPLPEPAARPGDKGDSAVETERVEDHAAASRGPTKRVVSSPSREMRTVTSSPARSGR